MSFFGYVILWLIITFALTWEYLALNSTQALSGLHFLKTHFTLFQDLNLSTDSGRFISYYLGWIGLSIMLLTNLYVLRKRLDFLKNFGKLSRWLDFHIFCGLVGPTFIVFHSDFKVNGLVAISFWSMLIAASSGVVGKFFYIHSASSRQSHLDRAKKLLAKLEEYIKNSNVVVSESDLGKLKQNAKQYVGAPMRLENASLFLFPVTVFRTICGDFRLMFGYPQTYPGLPAKTRYVLREYALEVREAAYAEPFHRMLGYWHTFHMPFTYFMYITAIIHVVAALMFGVAK